MQSSPTKLVEPIAIMQTNYDSPKVQQVQQRTVEMIQIQIQIQIQIRVQFTDKVVIVFEERMVQVHQVLIIVQDRSSLKKGWHKFIKCRSLCKTVEVPQVPCVEKVIVVLVVLQRRYPRSAESAAVRGGNKRHQVDKMVEQFLTHDRWFARCVSGTGSEHSGDCRETAGTETVQTIEQIDKSVKGLQLQFSYQVVVVEFGRPLFSCSRR